MVPTPINATAARGPICPPKRSELSRLRRRARVFLEIHRHAFAGHFSKIERIPIRQSYASVGALPTDGRGCGRTVDSISGFTQGDPYEADGVVGPRLDLELFGSSNAFEVKLSGSYV